MPLLDDLNIDAESIDLKPWDKELVFSSVWKTVTLPEIRTTHK